MLEVLEALEGYLEEALEEILEESLGESGPYTMGASKPCRREGREEKNTSGGGQKTHKKAENKPRKKTLFMKILQKRETIRLLFFCSWCRLEKGPGQSHIYANTLSILSRGIPFL